MLSCFGGCSSCSGGVQYVISYCGCTWLFVAAGHAVMFWWLFVVVVCSMLYCGCTVVLVSGSRSYCHVLVVVSGGVQYVILWVYVVVCGGRSCCHVLVAC